MPACRAGTSLRTAEPGLRRCDRRLDVSADFRGAGETADQASCSVSGGCDRHDFRYFAVAVENDNRLSVGRTAYEFARAVAKVSNLDPLHLAILAKILSQVNRGGSASVDGVRIPSGRVKAALLGLDTRVSTETSKTCSGNGWLTEAQVACAQSLERRAIRSHNIGLDRLGSGNEPGIVLTHPLRCATLQQGAPACLGKM
jgi:hypothetical protein